jgi:nitroreductase/NAD-dependent dihydropyrimidine dehydrogenase PreA subunit
MSKVMIDDEKCIRCGLCIDDCSRKALKMDDNKVTFTESLCNECSHCVAVCPSGAAEMPDYDKNEIFECDSHDYNIDSDKLLGFIKSRRSIRCFKNKEIEDEKIKKVIEAARYSPTGGNRQAHRYIVIRDKIEAVREMAMKSLHDTAMDPNYDFSGFPTYKNAWKKMYEDYLENKTDRLFFNAPAVIAVVSSDPSSYYQVSGAIAAANMELEANTLGLGTCYLGFLSSAVEVNPKIKEFLGMEENEKFVTSFVIGYPDVKYLRTVNRKPAKISLI